MITHALLKNIGIMSDMSFIIPTFVLKYQTLWRKK